MVLREYHGTLVEPYLKLDVNLLVIKRDDFFRSIVNNFTFYTEFAGEE
jgi:hypothetical protein